MSGSEALTHVKAYQGVCSISIRCRRSPGHSKERRDQTCYVLVPAIGQLQQRPVASVDLRKVCSHLARITRDLPTGAWMPAPQVTAMEALSGCVRLEFQ